MRSKELWLVKKNRATVKPDSSVAPRWMKTYSEKRSELRNLQILKKMLEKSSQFFVIGAACEPKSLPGRYLGISRASLLVEWKLTAKREVNCEIYKSWRKCWKNQVSFLSSEQPVKPPKSLPRRCLGNYRSWKNTLGKLVLTVKSGRPRGHLIWVLNERSVNDGGDFCLLWLLILKSTWYSVGDTF